ncbi:hypothetical protein J1605_006182 [Eschrichtius robustus]|uniref:Uncharacterized protein n=1 Tax=Eschrichtius robustus TaxID=9764 RepID=A0AB34H333_ESCRO|nr:hypothetical protein J1605_006182 [Eschrichtius robustus]
MSSGNSLAAWAPHCHRQRALTITGEQVFEEPERAVGGSMDTEVTQSPGHREHLGVAALLDELQSFMASVWIQKGVKNWDPKGHRVIAVIIIILLILILILIIITYAKCDSFEEGKLRHHLRDIAKRVSPYTREDSVEDRGEDDDSLAIKPP